MNISADESLWLITPRTQPCVNPDRCILLLIVGSICRRQGSTTPHQVTIWTNFRFMRVTRSRQKRKQEQAVREPDHHRPLCCFALCPSDPGNNLGNKRRRPSPSTLLARLSRHLATANMGYMLHLHNCSQMECLACCYSWTGWILPVNDVPRRC
jgi:hypothetical protein